MFERIKVWNSNNDIYMFYARICNTRFDVRAMRFLRVQTALADHVAHSPHLFVAGHYTSGYYTQTRGSFVFKASQYV